MKNFYLKHTGLLRLYRGAKLILALLLLFTATLKAQDIPLFSQKLTNSFIYNPSMAGIGVGSFTYAYRNNYSGVSGAPTNNFLSLHTPFANYRFGTGINLFQEEVGAIKTMYASAAFAYHININKLSALSFGVSGEYNTLRLSNEAIAKNDGTDLILNRYSNGKSQPDFSFGVNFQNRFMKAGIAANRLYTAWFEKDSVRNLANYYSGFAQGIIRLGDERSLLEPYVAFRKFSESNQTLDLGLFYTYDKKLTVGAALRSGNVVNGTVGYKLTKNLMLGYSREMIMGGVGGYLGSTNEFVLRLDFADRADKRQFRADYKSAMSYRKKSVTANTYSHKSPSQLKKSQKKLAPFSPSTRYQNTKKLSAGRKVSAPKSKYKGKKPKYGTKKRKKGGGAFKKNKYNPVRKRR